MRDLLYVPILHEEVDLGSSGPALARRGAAQAGERRWALHQETVRRFWESVTECLGRFDPRTMRIYQDGVPVDGALGRRIIDEGAGRGSRNYRLILDLLNRGAQLQAAEQPALLVQEYENLRSQGHQAPSLEQRERLLEERDVYIARVIDSTLRKGEMGVLFIGAGHDVLGHVASDIRVREAKDPGKLQLYISELLFGTDFGKVQALARYVAARVDVS